MKAIPLTQAAADTHGILKGEDGIITQISTNSKEIPENCLFLPLKGERFDGHDFIQSAVENGAAAVMSHKKGLSLSVSVIEVEDTRQALLDLAAGYRSRFPIPVVGLTGSVGKTTTKEMVWSVLSQKYDTLKTEGNFNNQVGLPKTIFRLEDHHQAAVLEMGMSDFREIASMTAAARPDVAIITNIGVSHIEFLGSREGICQAKLEILEGMTEKGTVILNGDEPLLWNKKEEIRQNILFFGMENPNCDFRAIDIRNTEKGVAFTLCYGEKRLAAEIFVPGRHNVMNALAAAAAGYVLGLSDEEILQGLAAYETVGMRQKLFEKNGLTIYEDCYNASPDSMDAALTVLQELPAAGAKMAVLGGMLEMGDYAKEGHRQVGRKAAACADRLYLYGPGAEDYREGALTAGMAAERIRIFDDHPALAQALREDCKKGDALLFKGSRGMKMETALKLLMGEEE